MRDGSTRPQLAFLRAASAFASTRSVSSEFDAIYRARK